MVAFFPDMAPGVGEAAVRRFDRNFRNTAYDLKSLLGSSFFSLAWLVGKSFQDLQQDKASRTYTLAAGKHGKDLVSNSYFQGVPQIKVDSEGKQLALNPSFCVAEIFKQLKEVPKLFIPNRKTAENFSNTAISHALFTVPAQLSAAARAEIEESGKLAGFKKSTFVLDPVAALTAYRFDEDVTTQIKNVCFNNSDTY